MKGVLMRILGGAGAVLASLVAFADDDRGQSFLDEDIVPRATGPDAAPDASTRAIADRIVNGRANIVLIGDSIMDADMSAALITAFKPRHGYRGYATSGAIAASSAWVAYTNARSVWSWAAQNELDGVLANIKKRSFIEQDDPDEESGDPGSAWEAYAAPCNIRRLVVGDDLPDAEVLCSFGSSRDYDHVVADEVFLTEPDARLRMRVLWFDNPDPMPFTVQGHSTLPQGFGGSTGVYEVPVQQTEELVPRWMELPEELVLGEGPRDYDLTTGIEVATVSGNQEESGDTLIIGGARVWNDAREKGIQWGWASAGGAQAREHTWVPVDAWRTYIEFQQADTYILQLGVNDLFHSAGHSGLATAEHINELIERIHEAHLQAQANDPEIQDPLFLLVSNWDSHNPSSGNWLINQEWRLLELGQSWIAEERPDTALIPLRTMVEDEYGQWYFWRNTHLRDRIHPRGPYWHETGNWWDEEPYPDGAMYFARLIWERLLEVAPPLDEVGTMPPPCSCPGDATCDGIVDGEDLALVLMYWGRIDATKRQGDIDGDGRVDGADLTMLFSYWGACLDGNDG